MRMRESLDSDLPGLWRIHKAAFGGDEEAQLVSDILADPSAKPVLSLLAFDGDRPAGHVLFSHARLIGPETAPSAAILAPLAVVPEAQGQGICGKLIEAGLRRLADAGGDLVFVLGHPGYYARYGFQPAGNLGLEAPFPIAEEHAEAWMVQALRPGLLGTLRGKVECCDALNTPELWAE